ncbi:UDP-glycosyltransferase family 37 member C1 [Carabus blaptoides fortunei]
MEVVHRGVPVLGILVYGDQMANAASFVKAGYGLRLLFQKLTEETFTEAIQDIINNEKYSNKIKQI